MAYTVLAYAAMAYLVMAEAELEQAQRDAVIGWDAFTCLAAVDVAIDARDWTHREYEREYE